jgi:very-short-patch-repair endonuclease/predicted transcriptional regulator of viral defense system
VLAEIALRQHGVVSLAQARSLGLTASAVQKRVESGQLHRIHRGVYSVGHARLTKEGRWMAAVLACGPRAVLSHRSAAGLWGLRPDNRAMTDVSLPSKSVRRKPGIEVHAAGTLREADVTRCDGIPCTTVARALLDLGDVVDRRGVERAIDQAEMLSLFDKRRIDEVLARAGPRRAVGVIRSLLAEWQAPAPTRRDLEERLLVLCRVEGLPEPEVNTWIVLAGGHAVQPDFLWRSECLVIETDGRASHGTRQAFERDRLRDQRLTLAGYRVVRFTWRQVVDDPDRVATTIRELLARR